MKLRFKNTAELNAFIETGALQGKAMHLLVEHDDVCTPGVCVCEPSYVLDNLTPEFFRAGQLAQAKWVRENTS